METSLPLRDPVPIGAVAEPAFVRLPDPSRLFALRAERYRSLAKGHLLAPCLCFLAGIAEVQHRILADLRPCEPEARRCGAPPLGRERLTAPDALRDTVTLLAAHACSLEMPDRAAKALARVARMCDAHRDAMIRAIVTVPSQADRPAEHSFVAAALQVHFAMLAARLDAASLAPVGTGACPACGQPPAGSMVVGWLGSHGARYCGCALCGTLWHAVRITCTLCGSTAGISYQEIDGEPGIAKAESCGSCHRYVKIFAQDKDPAVDIVADDIASLGLDLLMRETSFRRGGVNPHLLGY